jgi:hypothetical protein
MTPLEQVLVSQAAEESAKKLSAFMPLGTKVAVESFGLTPRHPYMQGIVAGWLARRGFSIADQAQEAAYLIRVIVQTLGTEASERVLGTEEVQSSLLPVGLPPLTLFKRTANKGHARFYLDVYETGSGRLVHTTPVLEGTAYLNRYTFLFVITVDKTDVSSPP